MQKLVLYVLGKYFSVIDCVRLFVHLTFALSLSLICLHLCNTIGNWCQRGVS